MYGDLYDEDTDTFYHDENTNCVHGTYIGTPGGPDIICGWCEEGVTYEEFVEIRQHEHAKKMKEQIMASSWNVVFDACYTFANRPTGGTRTERFDKIFAEWVVPLKAEVMNLTYEETIAAWSLIK